jgi:FMN phosphatase YigB (HAD superfamily)
MVPAFELGLPRIWINRRGEAIDRNKPPTCELSDLTDLPACVERLVQSHRDQSQAG